MSIPFVLVVAMATVFGPLCSWLALRRARSWAVWFIFGVLLGPIAAALLFAAPPGRCPSCGTPSRGWPRSCDGCGIVFGGDAGVMDVSSHGAPGLTLTSPAAGVGAMTPTGAETAGRAGVSKRAQAQAEEAARKRLQDSPETRPATRLGRRASAVPRPTSESGGNSGQTVAILGSGVYVGGSVELQIGSRYFLARVGNELQALGPIHMSPSAVATRMKLGDAESTVVADRLLITGRRRSAGRTLAFAGVSMEPGVNLERELSGRRQKVATS